MLEWPFSKLLVGKLCFSMIPWDCQHLSGIWRVYYRNFYIKRTYMQVSINKIRSEQAWGNGRRWCEIWHYKSKTCWGILYLVGADLFCLNSVNNLTNRHWVGASDFLDITLLDLERLLSDPRHAVRYKRLNKQEVIINPPDSASCWHFRNTFAGLFNSGITRGL